MTDNEIKKALIGKINLCKELNAWGVEISLKQLNDILDLINRQKAEIERLQANYLSMQETLSKMSLGVEQAKAEAVKEFAEELIYKIVNTPTKFESTYYMYRDGIAFRQNEIIDIIKEMAQTMPNCVKAEGIEAVKEFSHLLIDKSEGGMISISDLPDFVVEWQRNECDIRKNIESSEDCGFCEMVGDST